MAKLKPKPASIRDVAQASGVSLTTVSLILNNGDQRISQATRDRVLAAIDRLGYHPNRLAQGLQNRRSHILAILVPQLSHTFADVYFGELISGIYDQASRCGYKILLEAASPRFVRRKQYLELFDRCFVDGMLFMGSHDGHEFVHELAGRQRPFLLVNNVIGELDYVVCDYAAAGRLAAEHLVALGHRRIGMIHGTLTVRTARELKDAFTATLAERGIELAASHFEPGGFIEQQGAEAAQTLLEHAGNLTAIFAGNDKMAIGAMQYLLETHRRVPRDISIIGCDDIHQAAYVTPALTTVQTPLYDLGRRCCQEMIEILRGQVEPCRKTIPVKLIERSSTGPPPVGR